MRAGARDADDGEYRMASNTHVAADAHAPAEVAWGRERIEAAAMAAGATEHLSFRKRQRRHHPL